MEEKIRNDLKEAMKERDQARVTTLRMVLSSLSNKRIEKGDDLDEQEVLAVLRREVKQRKESADQYRETRPELAEKEESEIELLQAYLPAPLGDDELRSVVREVMKQTGASGPGDLGKVMGPVMGRLKGRAEGNRVREMVQEELSG